MYQLASGEFSFTALAQRKNRPEKFPFTGITNWIVLAVRWFVKYFFCSDFPDFSEKSWRGKKKNTKLTAKRYSLQANEMKS